MSLVDHAHGIKIDGRTM